MYNNDYNYDDGVERRPSNLDRDAKLNYQLQVNNKKRLKEKNSFNNGIYSGGLVNRNINQSPRLEFDTGNGLTSVNLESNSNISELPRIPSNLGFSRKYDIEEIDPEQLRGKLRNANKKTKIQFINEGYQADDVERPKTGKYQATYDNFDDNGDMYSLKKIRQRNDSDHEEEIEEITDRASTNQKQENLKKKDQNTKAERNESMLENEVTDGAIAPITLSDNPTPVNPVDIDYSIFDLLNDDNSTNFILKPAPIGLVIKCHIYRKKGLYPEYRMCLQREDASLILIMSAKKRKRTRTTCYGINSVSFEKNGKMSVESPFAKLKSNLFGTQFTLYDSAHDTQSIDTNGENGNTSRKEYCGITYALNVLGFKGPRQMKLLIPAMDDNFHRKDIIVRNESESIISSWKKVEQLIENSAKGRSGSRANIVKGESESSEVNVNGNKFSDSDFPSQSANIIRLANKTPVWNQTLKSFALNFNGRVTQASVKNFQIVHPVDAEYIVMQFGKISKDVYTCDYSYPLCALQAFGTAISSLDSKLACD